VALSALPMRATHSCALAALGCWLVLLASGDDFNLARALLPLPAPDPGAPLPLDDPNTDLAGAPESPGPTTTCPDRYGRPSAAGPRPDGESLPAPLAAPARGHPPRRGWTPPCAVRPPRPALTGGTRPPRAATPFGRTQPRTGNGGARMRPGTGAAARVARRLGAGPRTSG
jgi:hypothetical protein